MLRSSPYHADYASVTVQLESEQAIRRHRGGDIKKRKTSRRTSPVFVRNAPIVPASADHEIDSGISMQRAGDLEGAVECFRRALKLDPSSFQAYNLLGSIFASLKDWSTALTFTRAAVELNPTSAEIHGNLALLYLKQSQLSAAIEHYRQASSLRPDDPIYANSLGNVLRVAGQYAEAEASIHRALSLLPSYAEAYVNLGFLYYVQQMPDTLVEECYRKAIALAPDLAQAHANLSRSLLRRGDFSAGWAEHEWRWRLKDFTSPKRNFTQPQWKGEPIHGARILLHAEQGFGDTIQFLRYVPMVAKLGAHILLEVHPELRRLVESSAHGVQVISRGDPLPEFDWQCPLLSLPLAFGTELQNIPSAVPYLRVVWTPPNWLQKECPTDLHVGLVWAGGAINVIDGERSLSLKALSSLWQVKGVSLYSLQRGPVSMEADSIPLRFAGTAPQTGDFADTAAAISHLDLIVSVDTSVAHLAGALGKPVWILLPVRSDWRWLKDRKDSPWYPSARLFRQSDEGDWAPVIAMLVAELSRLAVEGAF